MLLMKMQFYIPHEASSRQHVIRSIHHQKQMLPGPSLWAASENVLLEWIRSLGKLLDPDALFLAAKEGCQTMGSSAYENNVSRLWRGDWKQNHSENSQMASTECTV